MAEALREKDGLLREVILEVLEDIGLVEAVREAEGPERVSRDEVFKVLEGRECTGQKNLRGDRNQSCNHVEAVL